MATAQYFQEAMQYLEGFRLYCTLMLSHCPQSLSWHGPRVQALSPVSELAMGLLVPTAAELECGRACKEPQHACSLVLVRLPGRCMAAGCQGCIPSCASSSRLCSCIATAL